MARMIDADRLLRELTALSHGQVWPGWTYDGIRLLIERQPTLTQPNEWVSVEERLPEKYSEYIVIACDEGEPIDERIWGDTVVVCADYAEKMQYKFELLPCPFCGGTARVSVAYGARVLCGDCGCGTEAKTDPAFLIDEEDNAIETVIKTWNTHPQLLTKEQIEALERMESK